MTASDTIPTARTGELGGPLPRPRGPLSAALLAHLRRPPHPVGPSGPVVDDPIVGEDAALALHLHYELHYRGLQGVDDGWEWEPTLLAQRRVLEDAFLDALVAEVGAPRTVLPSTVPGALWAMIEAADGPSLSRWMEEHGQLEHLREFAVHRSAYQLREADPHTFAIPRLAGPAKAALVEIQADEYGGGRWADMHSTLFADTMRTLDLDDRYGAYVDRLPGTTLATSNLVSLLGLHRRWRGALVGHLAVFEMTSVGPMGRYAAALRRLGLGDAAARFYDVHVAADEWHQHLAADQLAGGFAATEPERAGDVLFGARAVLHVEARMAAHLLDTWQRHRSSLLGPAASLAA